ncbi:IS1/IS1595 family N-terminal zinc-binding domain-containing protein [Thermoleptolyngbya sichuanensis]
MTCLHSDAVKNGHDRQGRQLYRCRDCGKAFVLESGRSPGRPRGKNPLCPICSSGSVKNGRQDGHQRYRCQNGHYFSGISED